MVARRGQGELGPGPRVTGEERVLGGHVPDPLRGRDPANDHRVPARPPADRGAEHSRAAATPVQRRRIRRGGGPGLGAGVGLGRRRERVDEPRRLRPGDAAHLAVGDDVEPDLLLQHDRVPNGVVEQRAVGRAGPAGGPDDRVVPQQAADRVRPGLRPPPGVDARMARRNRRLGGRVIALDGHGMSSGRGLVSGWCRARGSPGSDSRSGRRAVPFRLRIGPGEQVAFTVETRLERVNTWSAGTSRPAPLTAPIAGAWRHSSPSIASWAREVRYLARRATLVPRAPLIETRRPLVVSV